MVFEVSESECPSGDHLHLVVIAFGDGVVPSEAPHARDRLGLFLEGMAKTGHFLEAAILELPEHCREDFRCFAVWLFLRNRS